MSGQMKFVTVLRKPILATHKPTHVGTFASVEEFLMTLDMNRQVASFTKPEDVTDPKTGIVEFQQLHVTRHDGQAETLMFRENPGSGPMNRKERRAFKARR